MKLRNFTIIGMFVLVVYGCHEPSCDDCERLSSELNHFIGIWDWEHTIVVSNFEVEPGWIDVNRDTISPLSTGVTYHLEISETGCYSGWIDGHEVWACLVNQKLIHQENALAGHCLDILSADLNGPDLCLYTGSHYLECEKPDSLYSTMLPVHPDTQLVPIPDLLPGYSLGGSHNIFRRRQ